MAVFVLGMHRSGTSAITKAVNALGFKLGDNLMPAKPDNVKGFCEDWDVANLNEQILRSDTGSWDRLSLYDADFFPPEELERFFCEATGLLKRKFNGVTRFAIKDPRISLILPIWREACERQRIEPFYILCLRHPYSVASSLASRNAMTVQKALLLWLNHVYSILRDCRASLLIVRYENFLSDPRRELDRMAQFLGVTSKFAESRKSAISDLMEQFLDRRLDHFRVDYLKSCDWLALVDGIYQALSRYQDCTPLSADQQARLRKEFSLDEQLLIELNNSATATQREQVQRQTLDAIVEENRTLLESLEQIGRRLPYLDADGVKAASELSQLRSKLAAVKADRADMAADRRRIDIERLQLLDISHMAVQDKQRLEKELAVTKEGIANLSRIKDEFTTSYTSMEAECEVKNNELSKAVEELTELKDLHKQMSNELRELRLIRASRIWRMMAPLRWMLNSLYRN